MEHFKLHGTDANTMLRQYAGSIDLILTSPPYNIGSRSPRKDGMRKHGQFDPKSYGGITGYIDNLDESIYQANQITTMRLMAQALKHDGVLVYNHKPRRKNGVMIHPMTWIGQVHELTLMEEIIWDRGSTHNHSKHLFWPTTERLYVFRRTDGKYRLDQKTNNTDAKFKKDLWHVPLSNKPADGHACPFAETLANNVVKAFARPGDVVCDPYSGSGTTGVAALKNGCWYVGSEMDENYMAASAARLRGIT